MYQKCCFFVLGSGDNNDGYKEQTVTFHQSIDAFLPVQDAGGLLGGAYAINGYAQITQSLLHGKFQKWYLTIGASGATVAQLNGDVSWYGTAKLLVGGKEFASTTFQEQEYPNGTLSDPNYHSVGEAEFVLPITDQSVRAVISIGYTFSSETTNGTPPYPSTITHTFILK